MLSDNSFERSHKTQLVAGNQRIEFQFHGL